VQIPLLGPLDLAATLDSGQAFRWSLVNDVYSGVIGNSVVLLRQTGDGLEFSSAPEPEATVRQRLIDYLALDIDLDDVYRVIRTDEEIGASIDLFTGMRVLRQDPWECLASFICSSNSNIQRIRRNIEDIAALCGEPIEASGAIRHAFPTPERLASVGPEALRDLKLGYRARYLHEAAVMVAEGRVVPLALREADYEDAIEQLTRVPGVGDKVANCVALFSLEKPEAFPVDVWIHRVLEETYPDEIRAFRRRLLRRAGSNRPAAGKRKDGAIVARDRLREWAQERFGQYAGWANHYLFHSRRSRA
jgi:N-glycosylase/DNA lyase